ncbi:ribonuclease T2 [Roseobacter sinensis]|uniref:Ribonuclease T2 n=1 Tax=Roseobacter sinensis TaxID=2931391 RepID=A0ABT3BDR1_9RHOB|nr:ribonuclease T2 [Roseobacter sp. WL0113]MCV3271714.1 ribonuclease T2 [Roseobacter sp. WL0113]
MRSLLFWLLSALPLAAQEHRAGVFDYYVLSLSWSPNWCALEGDARGSEQCDAGEDHGWILHGLWPQYERGYPEYCRTPARAPSRRMTGEMSDIMGTSGLAWHQWKKHGTCSGLNAADYYALSREAYGRIARPPVFRRLEQSVRLPASVVEEAFLEANPHLAADGLTITCRRGHIQEARICLTRDLQPRRCEGDVKRDCSAPNALFTPVR